MIFYKFNATCTEEFAEKVATSSRSKAHSFHSEDMVNDINSKFDEIYCVDKSHMIAVSDVMGKKVTIVLAYFPDKISLNKCIDCINDIVPEVTIHQEQEIIVEDFRKELTKADRNGWLPKSDDYVVRKLGLDINSEPHGFFDQANYKVTEKVYTAKNAAKKTTLSRMSEIMASQCFYDEIDRIYSKLNEKKFMGHPVHYLITAGDKAAADDMIEILIPALIKNNRLVGGRVSDIQDLTYRAYRDENFYNLFRVAKGGTVIINLSLSNEGNYANGYHELLENIGKRLNEFGKDTLFIFVDVSGQRTISDDAMAAILANADMIRIDEGFGDKQKAYDYLARLAAKSGFENYEISDLTKYLPAEKTEYTVSDIYSAYNRWYGNGLKTHVYRAYKEQDMVKLEVKKRIAKPYEDLQNMIGLADVKRVTDEILAAAKMQKIRKAMGIDTNVGSMHMLFSGNPGTAKTTVARLLAQIFKDEEVLKNGHMVECGRQDLVGKYVGWTAKIVEEKFRAARGGILFIDEAYSLVEDHNSFGTEAINTIVQMMENYRDEVIVIFAGYPDKMQTFLDQNEGLKSRIAFHLNFPDYNADELVDILKLMAEKNGYNLDGEGVMDKCISICAQVCKEKDFGNGRFARNLLEQAVMRQANRLFKEFQGESISKENALTLKADDFEYISMKKEQKTFGFI